MTLFNQVLEYLYNPQWLKYFIALICVAMFALVVLSSLLTSKAANSLPTAIREQQQLLAKMAWLRGASNFYLLIALFAMVYPKVFYLRSPDLHIIMNLVVAAAISASAVQYLRARTLRRKLMGSS